VNAKQALIALALITATGAATGCRSATPEEISCAKADDELIEVLGTKVEEGASLRNGNIRKAEVDGYDNGLTYVSAEMLQPGDDEDSLGEILTWATGSIESGEFFSVDVYAREHSSWPHAPFDVTHDGAVESRGCVSFWAGSPPEVRETTEGSSEDLDDLGFESPGQDDADDEQATTTTTTRSS
jgi:hypothetical protein